MRGQWIAWWMVLVTLAGASAAQAQTTSGRVAGPTLPTPPAGMMYRDADMCQWMMRVVTSPPPACDLVPVPTTKSRSPKLLGAGVITFFLGFGALIGANGDTVSVLGDDYCVGKYSVDEGSCASNHWLKNYKWMLMGAGATMIWIGNQKVAIKPVLSPQRQSVTATLRW